MAITRVPDDIRCQKSSFLFGLSGDVLTQLSYRWQNKWEIIAGVPLYTKQKVTGIKDVEDLEVRIEKLEEIFSYLRNRKLKQKEVILGTDDETSSNDDTSSNDEISSNEFPADDEMFLEIDEVVFKIHTKGYFEYDPLRMVLKNGSINLYVAHKKQNLGKYYYKNMEWEEDEAGLRCSRGRKGKEKVIEDEGICSNGNKADVTIYKRAMVNGKAKMVEDIGAVKRGKERGVVIEDGGFINDGGKETVVTKRTIGSRKMEGKSVKVESE
ncbi:hypothetical protein Tco_0593806 [Tanacetum coccineum]